jgi:hypothetical protein
MKFAQGQRPQHGGAVSSRPEPLQKLQNQWILHPQHLRVALRGLAERKYQVDTLLPRQDQQVIPLEMQHLIGAQEASKAQDEQNG